MRAVIVGQGDIHVGNDVVVVAAGGAVLDLRRAAWVQRGVVDPGYGQRLGGVPGGGGKGQGPVEVRRAVRYRGHRGVAAGHRDGHVPRGLAGQLDGVVAAVVRGGAVFTHRNDFRAEQDAPLVVVRYRNADGGAEAHVVGVAALNRVGNRGGAARGEDIVVDGGDHHRLARVVVVGRESQGSVEVLRPVRDGGHRLVPAGYAHNRVGGGLGGQFHLVGAEVVHPELIDLERCGAHQHARAVLPAQLRVVGSAQEVPRPVRRSIPVQVQVPGGVDAGVGGLALQAAGGLARHPRGGAAAHGVGLAGGGRIPVAVGDGPGVAPGETANGAIRAEGAGDGVGGGDAAVVVAHEPAGRPRAGRRDAGGHGVAGGNAAGGQVLSRQTSGGGPGERRAGNPAGHDAAGVLPHQAAGLLRRRDADTRNRDLGDGAEILAGQRSARRGSAAPGGDLNVDQAQTPHLGFRAQAPEKTGLGQRPGDAEVADAVAVALEHRVVAADGLPPCAAVPVGVARSVRAIAVVVEAQVLGQLVAVASGGRTPHARDGVGEGRRVGRDAVGVVRRAVAVPIPPDRVQLRQGGDLDQAVIVGVIVRRSRLSHSFPPQRRVVAREAELPIAVGVRRRAVPVQVQVLPAGVDAGVADGRLQFPRGLALAAVADGQAGGIRVPVAGDDRAAVIVTNQAADVRARRGHRCRGVAGLDLTFQAAHQTAGIRGLGGVGLGGGYRAGGVAGNYAGIAVRGVAVNQCGQPADGGDLVIGIALNRAVEPDGNHRAPRLHPGDQAAGIRSGVRCAVVGDGRLQHAQIPDHGLLAQPTEHAHVPVGGAAGQHVEIANREPAAIEHSVVFVRPVADGFPAGAGVGLHRLLVGDVPRVTIDVPLLRVVGPEVVGAVDRSVPVGVEVQIAGQFVAVAGDEVAAEVALGIGEGDPVLVPVICGVSTQDGVDRHAVAVQVPADGVELVQTGDVDQAVVVHVVVILDRGRRRRRTLPRQVGVLALGAEGPQLVGVRRTVAVQVQVLPVEVDAGVIDGRLELVSALGHAGFGRVAFAHLGFEARDVLVPVAVGYHAHRDAHQAANLRRSGVVGGGDRHSGVAGDDGSGKGANNIVVADQPAGGPLAGDLAGGVAGDDPAGIDAHQHAGAAAVTGVDLAIRVHGNYVAAVAAHQRPDLGRRRGTGDIDVQQPQVAQLARGHSEEAHISRGPVDEEIADGMPVPVEDRLERRICLRADGFPAAAAVPVGVPGVGLPAAVGVEVQVGGQLVAVAAIIRRAAHAAGRIGEGGVVVGLVAGGYRSIPVQVPADGVQLGQGLDLDQAVIVGVVVHHVRRGAEACRKRAGRTRGSSGDHRGHLEGVDGAVDQAGNGVAQDAVDFRRGYLGPGAIVLLVVPVDAGVRRLRPAKDDPPVSGRYREAGRRSRVDGDSEGEGRRRCRRGRVRNRVGEGYRRLGGSRRARQFQCRCIEAHPGGQGHPRWRGQGVGQGRRPARCLGQGNRADVRSRRPGLVVHRGLAEAQSRAAGAARHAVRPLPAAIRVLRSHLQVVLSRCRQAGDGGRDGGAVVRRIRLEDRPFRAGVIVAAAAGRAVAYVVVDDGRAGVGGRSPADGEAIGCRRRHRGRGGRFGQLAYVGDGQCHRHRVRIEAVAGCHLEAVRLPSLVVQGRAAGGADLAVVDGEEILVRSIQAPGEGIAFRVVGGEGLQGSGGVLIHRDGHRIVAVDHRRGVGRNAEDVGVSRRDDPAAIGPAQVAAIGYCSILDGQPGVADVEVQGIELALPRLEECLIGGELHFRAKIQDIPYRVINVLVGERIVRQRPVRRRTRTVPVVRRGAAGDQHRAPDIDVLGVHAGPFRRSLAAGRPGAGAVGVGGAHLHPVGFTCFQAGYGGGSNIPGMGEIRPMGIRGRVAGTGGVAVAHVVVGNGRARVIRFPAHRKAGGGNRLHHRRVGRQGRLAGHVGYGDRNRYRIAPILAAVAGHHRDGAAGALLVVHVDAGQQAAGDAEGFELVPLQAPSKGIAISVGGGEGVQGSGGVLRHCEAHRILAADHRRSVWRRGLTRLRPRAAALVILGLDNHMIGSARAQVGDGGFRI